MRKEFLAIAAIAVFGAAVGSAMEVGQPETRPRVIGVVHLSAVDQRTLAGFKAGMAARGYRDGEGVTYQYDGPAGSVDRIDGIIESQVRQGVDLILASSTPVAIAAAKAAERWKVPVVFAPVNDPIRSQVVADLTHPGGFVTGIKLPGGDDLRLQWLTRIAPDIREAFVPFNPQDRSSLTSVAVISAAAMELNVALHLQAVTDGAALEAALNHLPPTSQAIFLPRDSLVEGAIDRIVQVATRHRLPVSAPSQQQVEQGALFSYGFRHHEIGEQAARLAVQILQGVSPGDIPVETAESWLAINLVAAATIQRHIPDDVLSLADTVIRK